MLYGLLLESAVAEEQQNSAWQTSQEANADEESWSLGMEAWVCCENPEPD